MREEPFCMSNVLGLALLGRRSYELYMEDTHSMFPDNHTPGLSGSFPTNIGSTGTYATNRSNTSPNPHLISGGYSYDPCHKGSALLRTRLCFQMSSPLYGGMPDWAARNQASIIFRWKRRDITLSSKRMETVTDTTPMRPDGLSHVIDNQ